MENEYVKVSVIIPVYNSEEYLVRCLESVVNQSYYNLEIIIINDGSNDNSPNIIKEYMRNDERIVYIKQNNSGLSEARNAGIEIATGDFLFFLDSDDEISRDAIRLLVEKSIQGNLDVAIGLLKYIKNNKEYNSNRKLDERKIDNGIDCINEMLNAKNIRFHAVAKLFRRELFFNIRFPINRLYEDTGCIYKVIYKAKRIGYINNKIYLYYFNNNSISKGNFNIKKLDLMLFANDIQSFLQENLSFEQCKDNYFNFKVDSFLSLYRDIMTNSSNKRSDIEKLYYISKLNSICILLSGGVQLRNKIKFIFKDFIYYKFF